MFSCAVSHFFSRDGSRTGGMLCGKTIPKVLTILQSHDHSTWTSLLLHTDPMDDPEIGWICGWHISFRTSAPSLVRFQGKSQDCHCPTRPFGADQAATHDFFRNPPNMNHPVANTHYEVYWEVFPTVSIYIMTLQNIVKDKLLECLKQTHVKLVFLYLEKRRVRWFEIFFEFIFDLLRIFIRLKIMTKNYSKRYWYLNSVALNGDFWEDLLFS